MKRILIVDDIDENRYLLRALLEGYNYEVDEACNGSEAIINANRIIPDLIISDILMPGMDGFTLCRKCKTDDMLKSVPFIFYTATYTDPRDEKLAMDMGADGFIIKPAEPDEFMRQVENILAKHKNGSTVIPHRPGTNDESIIKNYNEALIRKLEQKMLELEQINRKLGEEAAAKNNIEASLRDSEELFKNIFYQHAAVKLIIDPDNGSIIDANDAAVDFYGWQRDRLLNMKIQDINTLPAAEVTKAIETIIKENRYRFEFRHRKADGSVRDVEVFSSRIRTKGKELLHSIIHDITERKQAEKAQRESEEQIRLLLDSTAEAIYGINLDGNCIFCNNSCVQYLGYKSADELLGKNMHNLIHHKYPDGRPFPVEDCRIYRAFKNGENSHVDDEVLWRADGTCFSAEYWSYPRRRNGSITGAVVTFLDITERKINEMALKEAELRSRTMFDSASDGFLGAWASNGKFFIANRKICEMLGYNEAELLKLGVPDIHPEESLPFVMEQFERLTKQEISIAQNIPVLKKDKTVFLADISGARITQEGTEYMLGLFRDITDRKRAEDALRASEEKFRKLYETMMDAFVQTDMKGNIISFNNAFLDMMGYSAEEITRLGYTDTTPPKWQVFEAGIIKNQVLKRGFSDIYEKEYIRKDGTVFPVEMRTSLLVTSDGIQTGLWAIVRDITKRKATERELLLRSTAMNNAANCIIITDTDATVLYTNYAFEVLTGYSSEEVLGKNAWQQLISGPHEKSFYRDIWNTISTGQVWTGEIMNIRKNGSMYAEDITIAPVKDSEGRISNYVAIMQDITEKKFAADLLKTRLDLINFSETHTLDELMTRTLDELERFTGSPVSFFHFLEDDQKTLSFQAWSTATSRDYCRSERKGSHFDIAGAGVWVDCVRERKTVVHNDYMSLPHRKGLPEGHAPLVRELVVPIMRDNKIRAILGIGNKPVDYGERDISVTEYLADILWDILEKKRAGEYLKQINAELERKVEERTSDLQKINRELESFTYNVSHDLRAPLRHIRGYINMFRRETGDAVSEKATHYMDVITASVNRMGQLIEDLLSFSRIGRTSLAAQDVNMNTLADEILADFSEEISRNNIIFRKNTLPDVTGDMAMLHVVLTNLISNAIKFTGKTEEPVVEIGYNTNDKEHVFYIRDNGAGFDMKYVQKLFGVFQRLHNDHEFEGTGIGLAMIKNIIERHGGRVWAEAEPDKGACFYFSLPLSGE